MSLQNSRENSGACSGDALVHLYMYIIVITLLLYLITLPSLLFPTIFVIFFTLECVLLSFFLKLSFILQSLFELAEYRCNVMLSHYLVVRV